MRYLNNNLLKFINSTPNAYYCAENIKIILLKEDYKELCEKDDWELQDGKKYFVIRNDSSIIAFQYKKSMRGFNIVATHGDSPSYKVKPNATFFENGVLKLNIEGYGGMINYSWFDRPLSMAGRIIFSYNDQLFKKNINIDKDLMIIPSQAIHINRDVNEKNEIKVQANMSPILASETYSIKNIIAEELRKNKIKYNKIFDYDLYLYNRDNAKYCGTNDEFITGPRLDDLGCIYPSLISFINGNNNTNTNMFCMFNNEEIGSLTMQGADSTFLSDVLNRISEKDIYRLLSNSFMVSADNAHASHPNAASKNDPTNKVLLNKGIVIKHNKNYTTDAVSSSAFSVICDNTNIPYQDYACNSDLKCGATLGGISTSHVSIYSVDVGLPQLAMHSALETMGNKDAIFMYKVLKNFYSSSIEVDNDKILIKK